MVANRVCTTDRSSANPRTTEREASRKTGESATADTAIVWLPLGSDSFAGHIPVCWATNAAHRLTGACWYFSRKLLIVSTCAW